MKKFGAIWISLGLAISLPAFANGGACGSTTFEELTFAVCHIDPSEYDIELALYADDDEDGQPDNPFAPLGVGAFVEGEDGVYNVVIPAPDELAPPVPLALLPAGETRRFVIGIGHPYPPSALAA